MKIEVNHQFKFAYVWLTQEEGRDQKIKEDLQPIIDAYKSQKYKFVCFISGNQDLIELTKGLLSLNKNLGVNSENLDAKQIKRNKLRL